MILASPLLCVQQTPLRPAVERFAVDAAESVVGFDGSSMLHDFTRTSHAVHGSACVDPLRCGGTLSGELPAWILQGLAAPAMTAVLPADPGEAAR